MGYGFSCQEEYDAHMSAQGEADAMAAAHHYEGIQFEEKIKEAIKFLIVDVGLNPEEYSEHYEKLTYEQEEE